MPLSWSCTIETCPITYSIFEYRPSLVANIVFIAIFGACTLVQVLQLVAWRNYAYSIPILLGGACEIIGYLGRLLLYNNPWDQNGFLIQICCLTIGPAFYSAAIYFCIADIVKLLGKEASRLKPQHYAWIFIPCDIVSLTLQGTGGGLASVASQTNKDPKPGTNVMVAGLAFQVFSLLVFMILVLEFAWRARKIRRGSYSGSSDDFGTASTKPSTGRGQLLFFTIPFSIAILCIFIRCAYRVAELSNGWTGKLIKEEGTFIALEGVMIAVAAIALDLSHPRVLSPLPTRRSASLKLRPQRARELKSADQQGLGAIG